MKDGFVSVACGAPPLRLADCDIVQGYFYAKPMPIDDFRKFLQEFNERDNA